MHGGWHGLIAALRILGIAPNCRFFPTVWYCALVFLRSSPDVALDFFASSKTSEMELLSYNAYGRDMERGIGAPRRGH
jgi:hypothetical protein